jgi:hypothetical protein
VSQVGEKIYHNWDKQMRVAASLLTLFPITIGIVGSVSPDSLTTARTYLMGIAGVPYVTGPTRIAMGLVLILFAPKSRMPKTWRECC